MGLRQEGYWDDHYELELKNFQEDGDEGDVWFGKRLGRRIADWIVEKLIQLDQDESTILDVGCGNGFTLHTVVDKYRLKSGESIAKLKLSGIDYSKNSIDLSRKIVVIKKLESIINLAQCDFLDTHQLNSIFDGRKFDFIIDIGTFDAICLLAEKTTEALDEAKLRYITSLNSLSKSDGTCFIIASCNNTEEELTSIFNFSLLDKIETPKLQFGGKEGSQVTCLIFELFAQSS